jgi:hypothetical protein
MQHKELEQIFRQWCIKQGILKVQATPPATREQYLRLYQ